MAVNRGKNIRLFENPWLESQTHIHPATPALFWLPIVGYLFYRSFAVHALPVTEVLGLFVGGMFFWTFAEYVLHRWVFHYHPSSKLGKRIAYLAHGIHHDDPDDGTRLVMPVIPAVIIASFFYGLFRLILGPVYTEPFMASFLVGYLCYDYIHYYTHHFIPKTALGRWLKQNHMLHHYKYPELMWGVSSPLWDRVFGTFPVSKSAQQNPQALSK